MQTYKEEEEQVRKNQMQNVQFEGKKTRNLMVEPKFMLKEMWKRQD